RLDDLTAQVTKYAAGIDRIHAGIASGQSLSAEAWNAKLLDIKDVIHQTETVTNELFERGNKRIESVKAELAGIEREVMAVLSTVTVLVLVLAVFLGLVISRSITVPVAEAVRVAEALAHGDLSQQVE